jgi:hypothetical protein
MLDVNDDMENLFRRAAENYPLKTDGLDWEKVEKGLSDEEESRPSNQVAKNKTNRSWLLLALLIPVMWICNNYTHRPANSIVENLQANNEKNVAAKSNAHAISSSINKPAQQDKSSTVKDYNSSKQQNELTHQQAGSRPTITKNNVNITKVKSKTATTNTAAQASNKKNISKNSFSQSLSSAADVELQKSPTSNLAETKDKAGATDAVTGHASTETQKNNEAITESSKTKSAATTSAATNESKEKVIAKRLPKVYAGLIGTLDVSTVKFQSTKTPGKGLGLLVGFQITPRLSVESGASLQKKFYFSDAKYFNPKNPYSAPGYKLIDVDGNCNMWEVPINIKYDFKNSVRYNWFAIVGSSSYFMRSENYDYTYESYGQIHARHITYSNSSNNWFSMLNVSVGYARKIGSAGSIRIEPYFKVPLKGVGWGRLPITSTGLNIGYTRKLF